MKIGTKVVKEGMPIHSDYYCQFECGLPIEDIGEVVKPPKGKKGIYVKWNVGGLAKSTKESISLMAYSYKFIKETRPWRLK